MVKNTCNLLSMAGLLSVVLVCNSWASQNSGSDDEGPYDNSVSKKFIKRSDEEPQSTFISDMILSDDDKIARACHESLDFFIANEWPGLTSEQVKRFSEQLADLSPYCKNLMTEDPWLRDVQLRIFLTEELEIYRKTFTYEDGDLMMYVSMCISEGQDAVKALEAAQFIRRFFLRCENRGFRRNCPFHFLYTAAKGAFSHKDDDRGFHLALHVHFTPPLIIMENEVLSCMYYNALKERLMSASEWIGPELKKIQASVQRNSFEHEYNIAELFMEQMLGNPLEEKLSPINYFRSYFEPYFAGRHCGDQITPMLSKIAVILQVLKLSDPIKPYDILLYGRPSCSAEFISCFSKAFGIWHQNIEKHSLKWPRFITIATLGTFGEVVAKRMLEDGTRKLVDAKWAVEIDLADTFLKLHKQNPELSPEVIEDMVLVKVLGVTKKNEKPHKSFSEKQKRMKQHSKGKL